MTLTYSGSSFRLSFASSKIHQIQFSYSYMSFTICTSLQMKFHCNVVKHYQKLNTFYIDLLFSKFLRDYPSIESIANYCFCFITSLLRPFQTKTTVLVK